MGGSGHSEHNKGLVRRLVEEAVGQGNVDVLDELAAGEFAQIAKRWVRPFRSAFPDFEMEIVELIGEREKVVGRKPPARFFIHTQIEKVCAPAA